eukprot:tig00001127_g7161.t1
MAGVRGGALALPRVDGEPVGPLQPPRNSISVQGIYIDIATRRQPRWSSSAPAGSSSDAAPTRPRPRAEAAAAGAEADRNHRAPARARPAKVPGSSSEAHRTAGARPRSGGALAASVKQLCGERRLEEAAERFEEAVARGLPPGGSLAALMRAYVAAGRPDDAAALLRRAESGAVAGYETHGAMYHYVLVRELMRANEAERAAGEAERLLAAPRPPGGLLPIAYHAAVAAFGAASRRPAAPNREERWLALAEGAYAEAEGRGGTHEASAGILAEALLAAGRADGALALLGRRWAAGPTDGAARTTAALLGACAHAYLKLCLACAGEAAAELGPELAAAGLPRDAAGLARLVRDRATAAGVSFAPRAAPSLPRAQKPEEGGGGGGAEGVEEAVGGPLEPKRAAELLRGALAARDSAAVRRLLARLEAGGYPLSPRPGPGILQDLEEATPPDATSRAVVLARTPALRGAAGGLRGAPPLGPGRALRALLAPLSVPLNSHLLAAYLRLCLACAGEAVAELGPELAAAGLPGAPRAWLSSAPGPPPGGLHAAAGAGGARGRADEAAALLADAERAGLRFGAEPSCAPPRPAPPCPPARSPAPPRRRRLHAAQGRGHRAAAGGGAGDSLRGQGDWAAGRAVWLAAEAAGLARTPALFGAYLKLCLACLEESLQALAPELTEARLPWDAGGLARLVRAAAEREGVAFSPVTFAALVAHLAGAGDLAGARRWQEAARRAGPCASTACCRCCGRRRGRGTPPRPPAASPSSTNLASASSPTPASGPPSARPPARPAARLGRAAGRSGRLVAELRRMDAPLAGHCLTALVRPAPLRPAPPACPQARAERPAQADACAVVGRAERGAALRRDWAAGAAFWRLAAEHGAGSDPTLLRARLRLCAACEAGALGDGELAGRLAAAGLPRDARGLRSLLRADIEAALDSASSPRDPGGPADDRDDPIYS